MTALTQDISGVENYYVSAEMKSNRSLNMLYEVRKGKGEGSYGLQVLDMLGFDKTIIDTA
jgi:DNA mismatch repair ATPase MutS